jgi:hypothetical protein
MTNNEPLQRAAVYRPCAATYLVLDGIPGLLLIFAIVTTLGIPSANTWPLVFLLFAILILVHIWIASHRIIVDNSLVVYRTMRGATSIAFSEIRDVLRAGSDSKY